MSSSWAAALADSSWRGRLAARGVRTLVCEEHARVGDPVHCTGVLVRGQLRRRSTCRSARRSTSSPRCDSSRPGGIPVDYTTPVPLATVIDRPVFDRALADRADRRRRRNPRSARASARSRADASGVRATVGGRRSTRGWRSSPAARATSFSAGSASACRRTYLQTAQRELPARRPGDVELHFGQDVAPGGFAWAVPVLRREGAFVRIGVMASRDIRCCYERMLGAGRRALGRERSRIRRRA